MRIAIDVRALVGRFWFSKSLPAGVARYVYHLTDGLTAQDQSNEYVLFFNSFKRPNLKRIKQILQRPNVNLASFRFPNKIFDRTVQLFSQPKIDRLIRSGVDVFLSPHINSIALSSKAKHIQVVHDLSFAIYPEMYSWNMRLWHAALNLKRQCQRADKIIAVSQATKQDLVNFFDVSEEKIKIIYEGIDVLPKHSDAQKLRKSRKLKNTENNSFNLPNKYILYLGTLEPRKNVDTIIKAFTKLVQNSEAAPDLLIAGGRGWGWRAILRAVNKSSARDKIQILGHVSDDDLPLLYAKAEMLVWPSYYEGFGLPPLEAMIHGTPVIVSHTSSLPEILGKSAIYINPQDVNDLYRAMQILITNSQMRAGLTEKGLTQAQKFSWDKAINQVRSLIYNP